MAWHRMKKMSVASALTVVAAGAVMGVGGAAGAQTMSTNSASFNAGYGRSSARKTAWSNIRPATPTATG